MVALRDAVEAEVAATGADGQTTAANAYHQGSLRKKERMGLGFWARDDGSCRMFVDELKSSDHGNEPRQVVK